MFKKPSTKNNRSVLYFCFRGCFTSQGCCIFGNWRHMGDFKAYTSLIDYHLYVVPWYPRQPSRWGTIPALVHNQGIKHKPWIPGKKLSSILAVFLKGQWLKKLPRKQMAQKTSPSIQIITLPSRHKQNWQIQTDFTHFFCKVCRYDCIL